MMLDRFAARVVAALAVMMMLVAGAPVAAAAGPATQGYVIDVRGNGISAFDPATGTVINRISPGLGGTFAVRPDGRELWVADSFGNAIAVVSTATNAVVARIAISSPEHPLFTPDSRFAYVRRGDADRAVIDTGTRRVVKRISLGGSLDFVYRPSMSPDGSRIYAGVDPANAPTRTVAVISTATNTVTRQIPLTRGGPAASRIAFAPNGRLAVATSGDVIDTRTETVVRTMNLLSTVDLVFTPDSTLIYLANRCDPILTGTLKLADVTTGQTVATVLSDGNPRRVVLAPDGRRLYVLLEGGGAVAVLDVASNAVLDTFGVADPAQNPWLTVSDTAPARGPGTRFAPRPRPGICIG